VKTSYRSAPVVLFLPLFLLSGCLWTTRRLPVPKAPSIVQSVSPDDLVYRLNQRWDALNSLYANVEIQASTMKTKVGVEKDYTTFPGIILMRKPAMLRVYGRVPVIGSRMFDMVTDGKDVTLYIQAKSTAYKGTEAIRKKSANALENMRPGFFFDAMAVQGLEPDEEFMVTADMDTLEDAKKKHLLLVPEYILSVMRRKPGSRELTPMRVVTFHRDDLLPYQQDLYDSEGNLETEVSYGPYVDFGTLLYPSRITIKRPLEDYQVVMTVEKVVENMPLHDDQFQIKLPEGTMIKQLE
jgi:outer membrane lipoprotein-sorting protein